PRAVAPYRLLAGELGLAVFGDRGGRIVLGHGAPVGHRTRHRQRGTVHEAGYALGHGQLGEQPRTVGVDAVVVLAADALGGAGEVDDRVHAVERLRERTLAADVADGVLDVD